MFIAQFMASPIGRIGRVALGVAIIVFALASLEGPAMWIVAAIGLVPIAAGSANVCLLAPVVGAPFKGADALRR